MFTQLALEFNRNPQLDDDEGFEQVPTAKCPFDGSHIMQPKNLITHINRCKSPNKHLYVECRYDPCHWVYQEQLQKHYEQCPTRKQYYADLDLKDGDWDEQEFMIKLQQKALKQKMEKKRKKILKLMIILKLTKKLKKAATKQQFQAIKASLIKEQSCFSNKSKKNDYNYLGLVKIKSTVGYQPKYSETEEKQSQKTKRISNFQPLSQMNSSFYLGQTVNYYNFAYRHQLPYGEHHNIQRLPPSMHCQQFYQSTFPQQEYFPFLQQQTFFPHEFYWNSDANYPPPMRKKPQPEKGLMFSQTANTEDFIKKTYQYKNLNQEKKKFISDYPKNLQHVGINNQYPLKDCYQNISNFYDNNENYQNNFYPTYQNQTPFISNFVNYPKKQSNNDFQKNKNQKEIFHKNDLSFSSSKEHCKKTKSKKQQKQQSKKSKKKLDKKQKKSHEKNDKTITKNTQQEYELRKGESLQNELQGQTQKKILNFQITQYEFIPFDLHQNLTIRKPSSYQIDNGEEKSNFLEMKEMLQILQDK